MSELFIALPAVPDDPDPRPANLSWISGDQIYLARVTPSPETMNDPAAYEFFGGHDADGEPLWVGSLAESMPVVDWNNNCGCVTMTYNPGLDRYFMCITDGWPTVKTMDTYILESRNITGPWHLAAYMDDFGAQGYCVNIPSKFISPDGRRAWLCYSANFTDIHRTDKVLAQEPWGSRYGMCLQELVFMDTGLYEEWSRVAGK